MQVYLGTFHTDSPNWQRLRAGTTLLITVISITFSTVPFGRLRFAMALRDALHLFLLNFLGQPLSCHVGLVLLEGLIWCYHLQVTPNPPSPSEGKRGACNAAKRGHYHGFTYMAFFKRLSFNHHIVNRTCQNHSKSTHENWWTMKTTHQPFGRRFVSCQDAEG